MSLRAETRSSVLPRSRLLQAKSNLIFSAPIAAALLFVIAACSPGAAQKSDELVCEELAISRTMALASEMNEKSVVKEINNDNSSDYTIKILLFDKNLRTAVTKKFGVQIMCKIAIDVELMIDSHTDSFDSDVYTGSTEFNILFSRTQKQSTILEINGFEALNFWILDAWSKYIADQQKKKQKAP